MDSRPISSSLSLIGNGLTLIKRDLGTLEKRASNYCPTSKYSTPNGQTFSTAAGNAGCGKDLPNNDITSVSQADITSITQCMDWCSAWSPSVAYGVVFAFEEDPGTCYCKGSGVSTTEDNVDVYAHSALAVNIDQHPALQCPYNNASTQEAKDGSQFEIYCDQDMPNVDDLCPITSPSAPSAIDDICPTHADSLQDCLNQCSAAHPICLAVTYVPGMDTGYGNCYFKSNVSAANFVTEDSGNATTHMAILKNNAWNTNSSCTNGTTYVAVNEAEFEITCNVNNQPSANDLVQYHMQNMSACADACGTYTNSSGLTCGGVIFDSTMTDGYENCYLKSSSGTSLPGYNGHVWLQLTRSANGTSVNSSSGDTSPQNSALPTPTAPPSSSSSSKAWIAGPVIGGIAGLAAIAGLLFYLRRRRQATQPGAYAPAWRMDENGFKSDFNQQPMAQPRTIAFGAQQQQYLVEADGEPQLQELGGHSVPVEMPSHDGESKDQS